MRVERSAALCIDAALSQRRCWQRRRSATPQPRRDDRAAQAERLQVPYHAPHLRPSAGTKWVEACNTRRGSCYTLEADVEDGAVERIYFPSGGHLDLQGADLEDGHALGEAYTIGEGFTGNEWPPAGEDQGGSVRVRRRSLRCRGPLHDQRRHGG